MNITDVKIRKFLNDGRMKAIVSVTFDNEMAIHDIKVIEGPERLFVAMPSRKGEDGVFRDIAHPISPESRMQLEKVILNKYHEMLAQNAENMGEQIDVSESTGMDTNA